MQFGLNFSSKKPSFLRSLHLYPIISLFGIPPFFFVGAAGAAQQCFVGVAAEAAAGANPLPGAVASL